MHLFNSKTIARHLGVSPQIPPEHLEGLSEWVELIRSGRIKSIKETALHGDFKSKIVESILGYKSAVHGSEYTVTSEQTILRGSVDLALGNFTSEGSQIIAPFELKGAKTKDLDAIMSGRAKSPVQQAWEYATNAPGVKWVLVSNYLEIRLYGFGEGTRAYEHFDLSKLTDPFEYARLMLFLAADNLLSGKTEDLLKESRREDKDITDALYTDYKTLRGNLIFAIRQQMPNVDPLGSIAAAQTILDRVLFTAFAEDTGLLPDSILEKAFEHSDPFNPRPVWENFKGLFLAIDKGSDQLNVPPYNGGLFAPDAIVDQLTLPDEVCEGFKNIGAYDFASEISVTVLGHIFEQSIVDVERLQAIARGEEVEEEKKSGTSGRRKRDGVVYTPDYIARFIVEQTLGTHINEIFEKTVLLFTQKGAVVAEYEAIKWKSKSSELRAWEAYRDELKKLRIVDPACGSGVFLVMAFDFMKAELNRVNEKIAEMRGVGSAAPGLFDPDSEILTNNLFGVDVNSESVEIAKLSLWVKTARRGKTLDSLDKNLKVGDSLIEDSNYAYLSHGFTWATAFPEVFAEGGFDIVLGNPPYVRQERIGPMKPYLQKRFQVYHGVADLYCYFFERGLRLLKIDGRMGYICNASYFKTKSGKPLRKYLLENSKLEHVVDFGDIQVFDGVTTYPAIVIMRKGEADDEQTLVYWTVGGLPKTNFQSAYQKNGQSFPQSALTEDPWEFENAQMRTLRRKIRAEKPKLEDVYCSPDYGIKTGRNSAFVIDQQTRDQLILDDSNSEEITVPFLEGKDIKPWRAESRSQWLIFTRRGVDIDAYPAIKAHLERYRDTLEPKPEDWIPSHPDEKWPGRKKGTYKWYEIQDSVDYHEAFANPKIAYGHFSERPLFFIDRSRYYSNDKSYIIQSDDPYLLALLHSLVFWFLVTGDAPIVRGKFYEMRTYYIKTLPIPPATGAQKTELSTLAQACQTAAERRYSLQQEFARRIPDLAPSGTETKLTTKLKNWWLLPDFTAFQVEIKKCLKAEIPLKERNDWEDWITKDRAEITRLSAEIAACEDQINAIVYELFELTPDEIKLLEASI